jgi:hypothetical protein
MIRRGAAPADFLCVIHRIRIVAVMLRESGASGTLRLLGSSRAVSEYWIARSSRAMTAVGGDGPRPKFPFVINGHSTVHGVVFAVFGSGRES